MLLPLPSLPAPIPPYAKPRLFTDGAQTARVRKTVPLRMMAAPEPLDEEAPSGSPSEMSPAVALKRFMPQMSEFEKGEILAYSNVWYCGQAASKIGATFAQTANNHGYDDERGDYNVVMRDHVAYRYEVVSALGKGSFGQVVKVIDHRTQQMLALKVIRNKKRFHQQALVEVRILEYVKEHDPEDVTNAIKFRECFYFRSHLCITFELMSLNLYEFIKANNFQGVSLPLIRRFALQLLTTLRYLRRHRVIHCDLKPENILLKHPSKSGIKVIDFGSSCFEDQRMYTYIQSRFYRAPEVLLGLPYHCAIDMWSFGCILAELFTGYPIFPGENEKEQLACVMEVLGLPPKRMLDASSRASTFFEADGSARLVTNSRGRERRPATKSLVTALRCNDASFVSFLEGCLRWNAADRLTPDAALQHPFVTERARPTSPAIAGFANGRRQHLLAGATAAAATEEAAAAANPLYMPSLKPQPPHAPKPQAQTPHTQPLPQRRASQVQPLQPPPQGQPLPQWQPQQQTPQTQPLPQRRASHPHPQQPPLQPPHPPQPLRAPLHAVPREQLMPYRRLSSQTPLVSQIHRPRLLAEQKPAQAQALAQPEGEWREQERPQDRQQDRLRTLDQRMAHAQLQPASYAGPPMPPQPPLQPVSDRRHSVGPQQARQQPTGLPPRASPLPPPLGSQPAQQPTQPQPQPHSGLRESLDSAADGHRPSFLPPQLGPDAQALQIRRGVSLDDSQADNGRRQGLANGRFVAYEDKPRGGAARQQAVALGAFHHPQPAPLEQPHASYAPYPSGSQSHRGARPNETTHARADLSSLEAGTAHISLARVEQETSEQLNADHYAELATTGGAKYSPPRVMRFAMLQRRVEEGGEGELHRPGQVALMPVVPQAAHAPSRIPRHGKLRTGGAATARAAAGPNFFVGSAGSFSTAGGSFGKA